MRPDPSECNTADLLAGLVQLNVAERSGEEGGDRNSVRILFICFSRLPAGRPGRTKQAELGVKRSGTRGRTSMILFTLATCKHIC
jgi:hypothetical protein